MDKKSKDKFKFFQNSECEYFPCHKWERDEEFNCLFCYCPLYALGDKCGGNYNYTKDGIKDCSGCVLPHVPDNYDYVTGKFKEICEMAKKTEDK